MASGLGSQELPHGLSCTLCGGCLTEGRNEDYGCNTAVEGQCRWLDPNAVSSSSNTNAVGPNATDPFQKCMEVACRLLEPNSNPLLPFRVATL